MLEKYLNWLFRWRWPNVFLTTLLVGVIAGGGQFLRFTNDYRVFFSDKNPSLQALDNIHDTYTKDDTILFVVTPQDGRVFTDKTLSEIQWLTDQAWEIAYTQRVDSITNFQYSYGQDDELIVRNLISEIENSKDEELKRYQSIALNEPLLKDRLIAQNAGITGVLVTVHFPGIDEMSETPEVVLDARELAQRLLERDPNLKVRLTGGVMIGNAFPEASQRDIRTLLPVMILIVLLVLALLLRSLAATFCALLIIMFSVSCTMGAAGWLGFRLSPPSASAPNIILTIAVADCVHILSSFLREMRAGWISNLASQKQRVEAVKQSLRINLQPVFLTSLTTAVGFLSLNFSDSPPFHDLGNIVALGVGFAFLLSVVFLPPLLILMPVHIRAFKKKEKKAMERLSAFVINNRTPLLVLMTGIIIGLAANISRNELNDDIIKYFSPDNRFRSDAEYATEHLTGMYVMEYSLAAKEPGGINEPDYLQILEKFADWYRAQPETVHVYSIVDVFKRLNKNMHDDDSKWYRVPDNRELAAQYLLLYEMSLPQGLDLTDRINVDKSASRLTVTIKSLASNEMLALENRAEQWLKENAPAHMFSKAAGANLMFAHIGYTNIRSMLLGTVVALVLISLTLVFAFRSLLIGVLSLLPNLIPAAMAFGLWGMINGQINLGISVVAVITLGIVVDDTVHFLSKYLYARRKLNEEIVNAIRYSFSYVGNAIWITSLVLVGGFLVLTLSDFELNAQLGLMTAITISFALATDFFLLPPLLLLLDRKSERVKSETF